MVPIRSSRHRLGASVVALALVMGAWACSGSASGRPETPATLQIVAPEPNAVTGPDVDLRLQLHHARIAAANQVGGKLRPDRGHIHVSVDGQVTQMFYGTHQTIPGLTPGMHTIQAEFVASDHAPFANRVVAAVTFEVR
jgi:hypothetical protein